MICENCECEHNGEYGSGRFCSIKCSRGFATKGKRKEINKKVSKSLTKRNEKKLIPKLCKFCQSKFDVHPSRNHRIYCSRSCQAKDRWNDVEYKNKMRKVCSATAKRSHLNPNINIGWQTRKKLEPSYPEKIAIKCLNELRVNYEYEFKLGKYFIDFALIEYKIAIEIDGKQHNLPERIEYDHRKNIYLNKQGWQVFRIKYPHEHIRNGITEIIKKIKD